MHLYNTQSRKKEPFTSVREGKVSLYVCGITAYDYCHIGHARSAVAFDVLARQLRHNGFDLTFIRNFTDVDDKIINRAQQEGCSSQEIASRFIAAFHEDMDRLNILRPDFEPKATEHIDGMIAMCEGLIAKGSAYAAPGGDVYFRVRSFEGYGKLSGRSPDDLRSGARVLPGEEKEDPLDFALWKAAKPGEPSWPSPWGQGRPGWHIECSVMSGSYAPLPLDIHGGGLDLIFPHHENEIAQSEACHSCDLSRFWVHNGFVQIDAEKMSKSLGNFKTIRDILENYLPEVLRFFLLSKHYRSPVDFSSAGMDEAEVGLKRLYEAFAEAEAACLADSWKPGVLPADILEEFATLEKAFDESMDDDINTAAALGHIFGIVRLINRVSDAPKLRRCEGAKALYAAFGGARKRWSEVLGLFGCSPAQLLADLRASRIARKNIDVQAVESLISQREEARKNKDFAKADALRDSLSAMGVSLRDGSGGASWDVS